MSPQQISKSIELDWNWILDDKMSFEIYDHENPIDFVELIVALSPSAEYYLTPIETIGQSDAPKLYFSKTQGSFQF